MYQSTTVYYTSGQLERQFHETDQLRVASSLFRRVFKQSMVRPSALLDAGAETNCKYKQWRERGGVFEGTEHEWNGWLVFEWVGGRRNKN